MSKSNTTELPVTAGPATAESLWRRLPIWLTDVRERRIYSIHRVSRFWHFRLPWSHLMSVRMAAEIPFFVEMEEGYEHVLR